MMKTGVLRRSMQTTERGSAGSSSIYGRFTRIHPALLRLVLLMFALCVSVFAQTAPATPGLAELKKGDYDNALKLLSARLAQTPADTVAQQALLRVYIETGRYADAETTAKKFLQKTPDNGPVRHELA